MNKTEIGVDREDYFNKFKHWVTTFEMEDFKSSEILACGALIFNIHILRFKIDAWLQVDIDFNTESKFSCLRAVFFTAQWTLKTNQNHEMFFIHLAGLKGPPNHSVSKVSILCECKQTLLFFIFLCKYIYLVLLIDRCRYFKSPYYISGFDLTGLEVWFTTRFEFSPLNSLFFVIMNLFTTK